MIKIAVTGVESTGKSTLAQDLANHYRGTYVEEYARTFLEKLERKYTFDDILTIARNQHSLIQNAYLCADKFLFADTELLVTDIWCRFKFAKVHPWIEDELKNQSFSLYLLPALDLAWEPDPLRENPLDREKLFLSYVDKLEQLNFPYVIVKGKGDERMQNAIHAIESRF